MNSLNGNYDDQTVILKVLNSIKTRALPFCSDPKTNIQHDTMVCTAVIYEVKVFKLFVLLCIQEL